MKNLRKILKILATGTCSLVLAACYGMVYTMQELTGSIRTVRADDGAAVPGLEVELHNGAEVLTVGTTDAQGRFSYSITAPDSAEVYATVTDVDGPANGGTFAEKTVPVSDDPLSVEMDSASSASVSKVQ
jgi:hypothetical protein